MNINKQTRHNLSLDFVIGELNRRGYHTQLLTRDFPDADISVFSKDRTRSAKLIVKTYRPGDKTCFVGVRSEKFYGNDYFWVLAGIPLPGTEDMPEYYLIPNKVMAENAPKYHRIWLETPGRNGQKHKDTTARVVLLPPSKSPLYWDLEKYLDKWEIIEGALSG